MSVIRFFLSGVCHQLPEHCYHYEGQPLPLCARCMGTFLGILLTLITLRVIGQGRRCELPPWPSETVFIVLIGLWALDGANSLVLSIVGSALYEPSNELRLFTGIGSGLSLGVVLYPIYHFAMWRRVEERRVLERSWHLIVLLAVGGILSGIVLSWSSAPYLLWLIIVTGAAALVLSVVNALLIALLRNKEGFADHWAQLIPYLAMGFVATLLETGTLAFLRRLVVN